MRRPRALIRTELILLRSYLVGMFGADALKEQLQALSLKRFKKYNNYIRFHRKKYKVEVDYRNGTTSR